MTMSTHPTVPPLLYRQETGSRNGRGSLWNPSLVSHRAGLLLLAQIWKYKRPISQLVIFIQHVDRQENLSRLPGTLCSTFNMTDSGASRGEQASWDPTSSAPWMINFPPMASRPLWSMAVNGTSSWALMAYHPSVSQTTATGFSTLESAPCGVWMSLRLVLLGSWPLETTPQTQRTRVLAAVSSFSMIFLRAGLRLWSTSTSYLTKSNQI